MQQQKYKEYDSLLKQFTKYREQSVAEKEQMKRQIEKCKQQLEKLNSKLDKRVDARLKEEKMVANHRLEQLELQHKQQLEQLKGVLAQKDKIIEQIRHLLRLLETEKRELIQNHTKMLVELSQGIENQGEKPTSALDQNYKQLLKMYQFLIEENNQLKKEIYLLKRNNLANSTKNQSYIIKEEQSLYQSDYKPKSLTDSYKGEALITTKSQQAKERSKEKVKKPPLQKSFKK